MCLTSMQAKMNSMCTTKSQVLRLRINKISVDIYARVSAEKRMSLRIAKQWYKATGSVIRINPSKKYCHSFIRNTLSTTCRKNQMDKK